MVEPQHIVISSRLVAIEYAPAQRPWAAASFNPSLIIEIIGLTDEQAYKLLMIKPTASKSVVGVWLDDEAHRKIHVYQGRGDYVLDSDDVSGAKRVSRPT